MYAIQAILNLITDVKDEMLVDVIQHLTSGKTGDILFLEPEHFLKLHLVYGRRP